MRNVFLKIKALGMLLLFLGISNSIYAWPGNYGEIKWDWDYKSTTINTTYESAYFGTGGSYTIKVYALPKLPEDCLASDFVAGNEVGSGSYNNNTKTITISISSYYSDRYYCVVVHWPINGDVYHYYHCDKTQEDAFSVVPSVTYNEPCETGFSASAKVAVKNGSGSYTYNWTATNGGFYAGQGSSAISIYNATGGGPVTFTDVTQSKTCTCTVTDKVWKTKSGGTYTSLTSATTIKAIRFTVNKFHGLVYGGTGWHVLGSDIGGGCAAKSFYWQKSYYPTSGYSTITSGSDGYVCSLGALQFNTPSYTTFFKQFVNMSDCGKSGWTTTSSGVAYYTHKISIANVSAKIGSGTSIEIPYGGSTTLSCSSTGGRIDKTYTWYKCSTANGSYTSTGATGTSYSLSGLASTTYYKCKVTDPEHPDGVWSNYVTVAVRPQLSVSAPTIVSGTTPTSSGASVTLRANPSGGNGSYSYQWYKNGSAISGATSRDYTATGSGVTNKYTVKVSGDGQTKTSSEISVTWRSALSVSAPTIVSGTTPTSSGASVTLRANPSGGNQTYSYQWYQNGSAISGATSRDYTATGSGVTRSYTVKVSSDGQSVTYPSSVSITWRPALTVSAPTIVSGTTPTSSGASVTLRANPSGGNDSYTYQWYQNGSAISGATSRDYTATGSGETKSYTVKVSSDGQSVTYPSSVSITWRSALAAGTISGSGPYHYGANVTLTANPTGGDNTYSYQWQSTTSSTWSDIAGANSKTYSAKGYNQTISYRVKVSSDGQNQTSNPVDVTWRPELAAGAITGGNVTTYSNNSITLTAHPSGGTGNNYSYQWKQSTDDINWSVIAGQTGQTCTVTGSEQTMHFKVVVINDNQTKESQSVYITWGSALTAGNITSVPENHSTYSGGSITLTAHPKVGDQQNVNYVYQWQVEENSVWTNITNAANQSYTVSNTNSSSSNLYKSFRVKVSAESQTAYSARYEVSWRPALVAGTITGGGGYSYGASATLQAHPSGGLGGNNYSYQWQESSNNSSWSDITGANNKEYSVIGYNQTKYFRVKVSGDSQNKTTEPVQVVWRPALAVGGVSGGGVTTYSGGSVTLHAEQPTGGNGTYKYQWQESTDNINWNNITSVGDYQNYAVSSANPGSSNVTKYYRAVVTSDNQTKETQSTTVTYRPALTAGAITGGNVTTYNNNSVTLVAHPSGGFGENYSYQWQEETNSSWNDLQNATSQQLGISAINMGDATISRKYRVKVSGDSQEAYSDYVTISWRPVLVAGTISGATTTYSGSSVTLSIVPSGGDGNFNYQWQVSEDNTVWTDIQGAIYSSLIETGNNETDAAIKMYYRVVVSGDSQSDVSDVAEITRRPSLKIGNILGDNIVYGGDAVSLSVVATGGNGTYNYQWYRKGADSDWEVVGINSSSFSDSFENNTNAAISYLYKVVVSGDSQEKITDVLTCSWAAVMKIDTLLFAQEKLSYGVNTPITVIMINGSGIYDYQWQKRENGVWQDIPDTDEPTYIVENLTEAREFRCVVSDSLYPTKIVTTDVAQLDVYPDLIPGEAFGYSYTVVADPVTIGGTAASGGNGTYQYRWEKCSASDNGVFIPIDETTPTIDVLPDCNTTYRRYDISGDQEKLAFEIQVNVPLKSGAIGVDGLAEFYYAGQQLPMLENKTEASGGNVGGTASYQWYWRKEGSSGFEPIEGATEADYQPSGLPVTTSFYRAIVDGDDVLNSNVIELVIRVPEILVSNLKQRYCKGDRVGINASGVENGVYKWFDASGKQIGSGAELSLNSIDESATLTLKTFLGDDELLNEKNVALAVVDMTPDFVSDRIIVDAGDVVHFTNNGSDYTQCEWDFGDGADGSFESEPWHYYNHGGTFDVKLRLTSSEGCQVEIAKAGAITVNEAVSTDVEADKAGSVSVYPNPVTDWLTVEADGEFVVTITNNLGSVVFKSTASTNLRIDITNYPEGIYTVGVVDGAGNAHFEQIVKY